ncbi:hypothetical protein [Leifsonia xyli]|uniref:hypothetical protein n=1 Tax=Leifsonia xyli TaxID=1575 RepID=UPI003D6686EE
MAERHSRKPQQLRGWRYAGIAVFVIGAAVGVFVVAFTPWPNWAALSIVPFTALASWLFWRGTAGPPRGGG